MYVAYNRFYPPDLAHYEARNASPDRSHNETWDSLVITGVIGLLAYQFLFISFFMYGLRWVGLMPTNRERNIFIGLWVGLGLIGGLATLVLREPKYFGVGVPIGIMAGIILYLVIFAIVLYGREQETKLSRTDQIMIAALMAAVLAHYIEIHFGIAIASTRTMFWVFAGSMVVIGSGWLQVEEAAPAPAVALPRAPVTATPTNVPRHKKRRQPARAPAAERATSTVSSLPAWVGSVASYALVTTIILSTSLYEFVTNAERLSDPGRILWRALTYISLRQLSSYAILGMILLVWLMATLLSISEMARAGVFKSSKDWPAGTVLFASLSMGLALIFGLGLAGLLAALTRAQATRIDDLVPISDQVANILNYYYLGVFFLIVLAGVALVAEIKRLPTAWVSAGGLGLFAAVLAILVVFLWVNFSNLNPIRADIIYKQADPWDKQGQWDASIAHYKHAIDITPNEDFFYLWLGRAFLEKASAANVTATSLFNEQTQLEGILNLSAQQTAGLGRNDLLQAARAVLTRAREINPLNTDHSANLARLLRRWADLTTDPAQKAQLTEQASEYYAQATNLSPNNAVLWNEWALVDLSLKRDLDGALKKIEHSMQVDDQFDQTFSILGNIYMNENDLDKAAETYQELVAIRPDSLEGYSTLAYIYAQQGKLAEAIQANQTVLKLSPNDPNIWNTYKNLAVLYAQSGDLAAAINSAQIAASTAPSDTKTQLLTYISQLRAEMVAPPVSSTAPVTQ
jgi:tetratricopeptide (TPR) repeat protein